MNTRVIYWVKPIREKRLTYDHVFVGVELATIQDAEEYMDHGAPGNHLIDDAVYLFGVLEDWKVKRVQLLTDDELARVDDIREAESLIIKKKAELEKIKAKTKTIKEKSAKLDVEIEKEKVRLGWQSLTNDEMSWHLEELKNRTINVRMPQSAQQIKANYMAAHSDVMEDKFKDFPNMRMTNGWLDPYGEYHHVFGVAEHNSWACDYLESKGIDPYDEDRICGYPYEKLENMGWIRIMDWGTSTGIKFGYEKKPTHDQEEFLYLFCSLHRIDNPFK
jgi:hypothetical protein